MLQRSSHGLEKGNRGARCVLPRGSTQSYNAGANPPDDVFRADANKHDCTENCSEGTDD